MRKWSLSTDDDHCLVNVVSSFRYPTKERTIFWSAKIKMRILSVNVKIDPHEYVYQGFPSTRESKVDPQMITTVYSIWYLNFGTRKERTVFWWAKIKTHTLSTNVKIDPQEYVYKGSSPPWQSEVHPQMMTSVDSLWYVKFGARNERSLFCDRRK